MSLESDLSSPSPQLEARVDERMNKQIKFQPETSFLLRAGAGAGKTTTLIRLFFETVDHFRGEHQRWPRIVLTTFTRKATQEIRERLITEALRREDHEIFQLLQSRHFVQISTIHGILSLFLSRAGDRLGFPRDFQLLDDQAVLKQAKSILRKEIERNPESVDLLEEFNFIEVLHLVRGLGERGAFAELSRYTRQDLEDDLLREIEELKKQVADLIELASREPLTEKWQEFIQHLVFLQNKDLQNKVLQNKEACLAESFEQLKNFVETRPNKPRYVSGKSTISESFNEQCENLIENISLLVAKKLSLVNSVERYEKLTQQLEALVGSFRKSWLKHQADLGFLTMEDLEVLSCEILKQDPGAALEFSKSWDFWMVDEYQDTSPRQAFLLHSLRGRSSEFVVGDPQQSIYLFRGARSEVFLDKQSQIQAGQGLINEQLTNYRSRREVLEFINFYFSHFAKAFSPMEVGSKLSMPESPACFLYPEPDAQAGSDAEAGPHEKTGWTERAAISRIQELISQGVSPEDICVLSRSHRNLDRLSEPATLAGIPFFHHSAGQFYEKREVKDALQLLRFLDNPHDNVNFVGLLRSPWMHKSDEDIRTICQGKSYWEFARKEFASDPIYSLLAEALTQTQVLGDLSVWKKLIIDRGLIHSSTNIDPTGQREANLWKLIHLCEAGQREGTFQVAEFLDRVHGHRQESKTDETETSAVIEPARVQLMTIHAAKGLQFPHIIVTGFGDSSPARPLDLLSVDEESKKWSIGLRELETGSRLNTPLAFRVQKERKRREQEESNRLLYVALTRAQESLTLVWGKVRLESWAATVPVSLTAGVHQFEGFRIEVRRELAEVLSKDQGSRSPVAVRPPWSRLEADGEQPLSVTSISSSKGANISDAKMMTMQNLDLEKSKRGQLAHRIFETMKYNMDLAALAEENREFVKAIDYMKALREPPLQEMLPSAFAEWGFVVDWEGHKLSGQIDLWAIHKNCLWVIDYKTGTSAAATQAQRQLEIYAECLFKAQRVPRDMEICLAAIYPLEEKIHLKKYANRRDLRLSLVEKGLLQTTDI